MRAPPRPWLRHWLTVLTAVVLMLNSIPFAWTQSAAPRIAYVDSQRIISESTLFTIGREKITEEFSSRNQAFKIEEARLRELELRRDRELASLTSPEAIDLRREIETLDRSIQRSKNEMNQALSRRIKGLNETIDRLIREEIGAYAREQALDLVLTDGVGFAHPRLDITDEILRRVNAQASELREQ